MTYIEIRGTDFINKGAELMLIAALDRLGQQVEGAKFVMAPSQMSPYEKRIGLMLYQKIQFKILGYQIARFGHLIPKKFQKYYGLVPQSKINYIFDASGFSYSDQWGSKSIDDLFKMLPSLQRNKTKLIFLPQAFGPFNSRHSKIKMKAIFDYSSLIFARDNVSYDFVLGLCEDKTKLLLSPDFTSMAFTKNVINKSAFGFETDVIVVPNQRLIDKLPQDIGKQYFQNMCSTVEYVQSEFKANVAILSFEKNDIEICKQIAGSVKDSVEVIASDNVKFLKTRINGAKLVIGSRYHALISSLSLGIPTIGIGWSHKYEELFTEYQLNELCLSSQQTFSSIEAIIKRAYKDEFFRKGIINRIDKCNEKKEIQIHEMWQRVFDELSCTHN